jgi:hypothetical protein
MSIKESFEEWQKNLGETRPWDMINPNVEHVSKELADQRFSICMQCPELLKIAKQCKKCGCIMTLKTKLKKAECPLHKW